MNGSHPRADETGGHGGARRRWWPTVLLLAAICFLAHFNRVSMAVAGDMRIMTEYGISPTTMGWIYSAFLAAYTLFMVPGGWLIDRRGPRFSLALVCVGSAMFVALTGATGWMVVSTPVVIASLLVIRATMGAVSAPLHPAAANAVSMGVPPRRRSAANGIVTGAALLGVASTYVVFGGMIEWIQWPAAFVIAATVTAAVGLVWTFSAGESMARKPVDARDGQAGGHVPGAPVVGGTGTSNVSVRDFLRRNRNLLLLTGSYAAVGYFQYLFFFWMHYYFSEVLRLGGEASKFYAAVPPLAMAVAMPLGGWLSDRLQALFGWRAARTGLAMTTMSASAGLLLLGTRAVEPVWIVTWFSLALGVLGMVEGAFWVTAVEVGGNRGGLSAGIFNTGGNAGGIVAPIITPWISHDLGYGWGAGIGLGAVVCLVGAVLWYWIEPTGDDHTQREPVVSPLEPSYIPGTSSQ